MVLTTKCIYFGIDGNQMYAFLSKLQNSKMNRNNWPDGKVMPRQICKIIWSVYGKRSKGFWKDGQRLTYAYIYSEMVNFCRKNGQLLFLTVRVTMNLPTDISCKYLLCVDGRFSKIQSLIMTAEKLKYISKIGLFI